MCLSNNSKASVSESTGSSRGVTPGADCGDLEMMITEPWRVFVMRSCLRAALR